MGEQDRLGHLAHRLARIHAELLDAPEGIRFFEALGVHEQALGALHDLEHLPQVEPDQRLVVRYEDAAWGRLSQVVCPPYPKHVSLWPHGTIRESVRQASYTPDGTQPRRAMALRLLDLERYGRARGRHAT